LEEEQLVDFEEEPRIMTKDLTVMEKLFARTVTPRANRRIGSVRFPRRLRHHRVRSTGLFRERPGKSYLP
jgi:hypothetical protein